uniref:50S ribosomal protein L9, chloroplastic n=1 Tax=Schizymenia dubyi TaxID=38368 RepID=A0A1C9C9J4_9FLOR|nr:ribosomal protein L9 [Schizymenia dubyi]AOM65044.1 ribosomal protein L9 [Schizymenia dubyi]
MKRKVQVIIKKKYKHLGETGEIVHVNPGYAFNYLIPNSIVQIATKGVMKHTQMLQTIKENKLQENINNAKKIKQKLIELSKISIKKKTGDNEQIFGSISEKEIIEEIFLHIGEKLDKKQIQISEIKKVGIYTFQIKILENVIADLKLQILPKNT